MRISISFLFFLMSMLEFSAQVPFQKAVNDIQSHFNVQIFCPQKYQPANVNPFESLSDKTLEESVSKILEATILDYFVYDDRYIIIGPKNIINSNDYKVKVRETEAQEEDGERIESFTIGDPNNKELKSKYTIRLFIADDNVKEPLIGVAIRIKENGDANISDEIGLLEFDLEKGQYTLEISYLGYITKEISVNVIGDGKEEVLLAKEAYQLQEVTINAESGESSVTRSEIGLESLSAREIQKLPSLLGEADVIKTLLLLPGVSTVGEGSSGVNIRGGSVDQNLIMQDGIPLFNASHVLGLFSLFNPDMVKSIELYKGSLPARFGGKVSSVMDVELKDGNFTRYKGRGGLGLISSRLTLEGPLVSEKVSFIVGGRYSFSDYIFSAIRIADIRQSRANFYDANAKVTARIGGKGKLVVSGYTSFDRFKFGDNFDFNWRSNAVNANFNYIIKPNVSFSIKSAFSKYVSELIDPALGQSFSYQNGINNFKIKPYLQLSNVFGFNSYIGLESNFYNIQSGEIKPIADDSPYTNFSLPGQQGVELAGYIDIEKEFARIFELTIGVRYSHFRNLGPGTVNTYAEGETKSVESVVDQNPIGNGELIKSFGGLEPRSSLKIQTSEGSSIKMSFNITRQYLSQLFNTTSVTPVDLWYMSNTNVNPLFAKNYSLGFFFNLGGDKWENSAEVFYRDIDNIIEYKDIADLFLNTLVESELLPATGRSYGLELSVKKNVGRLTGRFSYTLSRTESKTDGDYPKDRINNNNWFPSNFDRPHDFSWTSSYQFTKRSYASLNFVYSSGRPVSAPTGNITVSNLVNIPIYGSRNNYRIPDYHRLDFSYTIEQSHKKNQKWRSSWTFSVYNLYGRRNAFSVFFTQRPFQSPEANRLSVLARPIPSITYNFNF